MEEKAPLGHNGPGYEVEDASVREIVFTGIGLAVGTLVVCLLTWGLFNISKTVSQEGQPVNPMARPGQLPPEPRVEVQPWVDLENLRRHEEEVLQTYGWADKGAGKVRLPVDRAIDVMAARGLPVRGGQPPAGGAHAPAK